VVSVYYLLCLKEKGHDTGQQNVPSKLRETDSTLINLVLYQLWSHIGHTGERKIATI
jgi:hypothetical protein